MSAPPLIPGYECVRQLGIGGCATVWHYRERTEQIERDVAIKVLNDLGMGDVSQRLFLGEVRAMAKLGSHPNIVQVFKADTTPAGEQYIVMPFYPHDDLATIARSRPLPVAEALEIGIRLTGAVETAHNAGILHRDIKPANVLTDEYGQPRLTDFGIAGRIATIGQDDSGLSVPWAAPEVVRGGNADIVTDVYSLAATVWQLLVGRSPFSDAHGRDDSMEAITQRVLTMPPPPTGRPDVPRSLELALSKGLAKEPAERPRTAAAFGRRLQDVQRELDLSVTPIVMSKRHDVTVVTPAPSRSPEPSSPEVHTRLRRADGANATPSPGSSPVNLDSAQPHVRPFDQAYSAETGIKQPLPAKPKPASVPPRMSQPVGPTSDQTYSAETAIKQSLPAKPKPAVVLPRPRRLSLVLVAAGAAIAAAVTGAMIVTSGRPEQPAPQETATREVRVQDAGVPGANVPPGVPTITPERLDAATVRFTWTYSAQLDSDTFAWRTQDGSTNGTTATTALDLPAAAGSPACLQIKVVRADGSNATTDWSPAGCSS